MGYMEEELRQLSGVLVVSSGPRPSSSVANLLSLEGCVVYTRAVGPEREVDVGRSDIGDHRFRANGAGFARELVRSRTMPRGQTRIARRQQRILRASPRLSSRRRRLHRGHTRRVGGAGTRADERTKIALPARGRFHQAGHSNPGRHVGRIACAAGCARRRPSRSTSNSSSLVTHVDGELGPGFRRRSCKRGMAWRGRGGAHGAHADRAA